MREREGGLGRGETTLLVAVKRVYSEREREREHVVVELALAVAVAVE